MPDTTYHLDIIALIALVTSIVSLLWNIIRDLIVDRVRVTLSASAGGLLSVQGIPTRGVFRDADSEYTPTSPQVGFTITNIGRRPVLLSKIWGKYSKKAQRNDAKHPMFILNTVELPKMIEPYETIMELCNDQPFMADLKANRVSHLYVQDSKGKDWRVSKKGMARLQQTVNRINL